MTREVTVETVRKEVIDELQIADTRNLSYLLRWTMEFVEEDEHV